MWPSATNRFDIRHMPQLRMCVNEPQIPDETFSQCLIVYKDLAGYLGDSLVYPFSKGIH